MINIGSIDGIQASPTESFSYSASKAAVHQLTKHLARHVSSRHILVNAIAPGFFPSAMTAWLKDYAPAMKKHIPLQRSGGVEDIAGTAIYLSSRASGYTTGSIIVVDGGLLAASRDELDGEKLV